MCCGKWSHIITRVVSTFNFTQYTSVGTSFDCRDRILLVYDLYPVKYLLETTVNFSRTTPATGIMDYAHFC